jgi:hypothetical protein
MSECQSEHISCPGGSLVSLSGYMGFSDRNKKYPRLGDSQMTDVIFLTVLKAQKCKIKGPAVYVSGEDRLPAS